MKRQQREQSNSRIHLRQTEQETAQFQHREQKHDKKTSVLVVLAVALVFLFFASLLFIVPYRQWGYTPAWFFSSVQTRFEQFYQFLFGKPTAFGITVYQYLAVMLVGAALAACGTIFQGSFKNILAGPSTMGVMSGGTLGCLLYVLLCAPSVTVGYTTADVAAYMQRGFFEIYQQQLYTLVGCFASVALVLAVATAAGRGRLSPSAMILSGTVFSTITGNFSMLIQYYMIMNDPTDPRIDIIQELMMGSMNRVTSAETVLLMAVPILACLALLLLIRGRLNLMSLSEDEALTMGVNVPAYRYGMIVVGTVLTAVVVAFCGHIGFLGFMIPLVGRKLVGPDMRMLLPASMLLGAILLVLVFDAAYIAGMTSYLGVFTSSIGGVVMIITLLKKKGGRQRAVV